MFPIQSSQVHSAPRPMHKEPSEFQAQLGQASSDNGIPPSMSASQLFAGIMHQDIEAQYLKNNPDVAEAVKAGLIRSGHEHYLNHGKAEGRDFGPEIVAQQRAASGNYLLANPDVLDAIRAGGSIRTARQHFEAHGANEGRTWNPPTLDAIRALLSPAVRD